MKAKVALAVAIALAIIAAVGIRSYIRQEVQSKVGTRKMVTILVAKNTIKKDTKLTADMVEEREADASTLQEERNVLRRDLERFLGQPLTTTVEAGKALLWANFMRETTSENPAASLPSGYRQITIPVDKVTGCAGRLLPGSVVDVLVTLRVRRGENAQTVEPVTQTVLTHMEVVATDLNTRQPYAFEPLSPTERRDFAAYSTVTLKALPLQAVLLAFLAEQGKMHLLIRGPDDPTGQDPSKIDKVSLDNLDTLIKKASEEKPPQ